MINQEQAKEIRRAIQEYDLAKNELRMAQDAVIYFAVENGWGKEDKSDVRVARAYLEGLIRK